MQVPFTKMNSQGNDFVVIDNTGLLYQFDNKKIRSICSRDIIGCDQLLLLNIKDSNNVTCEIFQSRWLVSTTMWEWDESNHAFLE